MKRGILIFVILVVILSINFVNSDGCMVIYDPDMYGWTLLPEETQYAFINHKDGNEKLILSISVGNLSGDKVAWIFPVPSSPSDVEIDILNELPRFWAPTLADSARQDLIGINSIMYLSQVYTLPFAYMFYSLRSTLGIGSAGIEGFGKGLAQGVEIHQHLEKMGLTTELISTKDRKAFTDYLSNKELELPPDLDSKLDYYINKDYSFVVSWISDVEKFKNESLKNLLRRRGEYTYTLGVSVDFPSEKIYYPLKLTSIYGKKKIPIAIYVMDYVTPELYPDIEENTDVVYYYENYYEVPENLTSFFGEEVFKGLKYTKIKIETESEKFSEDLYINKTYPKKLDFYFFIKKYGVIYSIFLFVIISCLSSLFSGLIIFRENKPVKWKFLALGLFNLLSFIGFSIASCLIKLEERFMEIPLDKKEVSFRKVIIRSLIISLVIFALIISFFTIISRGYFLFDLARNLYAIFFFISFFIGFIIISCLFFGPLLYAKQKNVKLMWFLILFSVLFIIILTAINFILLSVLFSKVFIF